MPKRTLLLVSLASLLGLGLVAHADGKHRPPRPPKAAIDACAGRAAGDACSFEGPDGAVTGACWKPSDAPADAPLACRPDQPPPPPPEAVDACDGRAAGDACTFDGPDGRVEGTCWKPGDAPADAPLACAP